MNNSRLNWVRRAGVHALLVAPLLVIGQGCTDLTEVPQDALTPTNAFHTDAEVLAGVAGVYAGLRDIEFVGYITLNELTTDAMIVPTRGNDWYDNGRWLEIHRQTWTASSGSALDDMNGAWNSLFSGVAKANLMIDVITKAGGPTAPRTLAELRTLRAWDYYMLQDMFGGVPIVTSTELKQYPTVSRDSVFRFIAKELTESRAALPDKWDASGYGRVTKGVADAILASLYLNAGVFSKNTGVNPTSYNTCNISVGGTNACQAAIDAADRVINSGTYQLNPNWKNNFALDNETSPENIFVIVHVTGQDLGGNFPMRTLHYTQLVQGPWNGFATLAETYNAFDPADERKGMWLAGQAYSFETGAPVNDRTGAPLIFTDTITDANNAGEGTGVRFNKFPPLKAAPSGNANPNDFTLFRLAEMYLIKAEALNEMGNLAGALTQLNIIHSRHFNPPQLVTASNQAEFRDLVLKERLLELTAEGKRRTDLVRHGKFLNRWSTTMRNGKVDKTGEPYRILFPIPATQIASNPLLKQNPGY